MPVRVARLRSVAWAFCLLSLGGAGCTSPLPDAPERPNGLTDAVSVSFEPAGTVDAAPSVLRAHLRFGIELTVTPDLGVFGGALSASQIARIHERDLPASLAARLVPSRSWLAGPKEVVVAPLSALIARERYTIAGPDLGAIATFAIAPEAPPYFARLWPPLGSAGAPEQALYCSAAGAVPPAQPVVLEPGAISTELMPGVDSNAVASEHCFRIAMPDSPPEGAFLPPASLAGSAVDPAPLEHAAAALLGPVGCASGEQPFGPGCAAIEDDRMWVRTPAQPSFWSGRGSHFEFFEAALGSSRFVVRGLLPLAANPLDVFVAGLAGDGAHITQPVITAAARAHVVINEVLANPAGPESDQEWVELVNDGALPVELAGFELSDGASSNALPAHRIEPATWVLLVSEGFQAGASSDVPPPPSCPLLRMTALGKNGLSNAGEALALSAPDGRIVSRFPARAAAKAGVSEARREPWSADDDAAAFGAHANPGASPCAPNSF